MMDRTVHNNFLILDRYDTDSDTDTDPELGNL